MRPFCSYVRKVPVLPLLVRPFSLRIGKRCVREGLSLPQRLFTRVRGREILRSSFAATCIVHTYRARLLPGSWPDAYKSTLPVVVALDRDARSCNPRTAPTVPGVHHHRGFLCTLSNPSLVSYTRSTAQQPNLSAAYRCGLQRRCLSQWSGAI